LARSQQRPVVVSLVSNQSANFSIITASIPFDCFVHTSAITRSSSAAELISNVELEPKSELQQCPLPIFEHESARSVDSPVSNSMLQLWSDGTHRSSMPE
jgi:hypothetical protein